MAGGFGTRLKDVTGDEIPKPMARLCGKPILSYAVETLKNNGVDELFISVSYLSEKIIEYFGDGSDFGIKINYLREETPLGSGGALYYLKGNVKGDFIVCSGDTVFDIDVSRMLAFHKRRRAAATLFTHPNSHPYDSDLIICDRFGKVLRVDFKGGERHYYKNNVNAGFFIVNSSALKFFDFPKKVNMEHDFINSLINSGERVYAYKSPEFIKDVGTPERFNAVAAEIAEGLPAKRNLSVPQKAVFLDRDGTINKYKGFIRSESEIELVDGAAQAIKRINESGYLAVIVSNQPVVARGEATFKDVDQTFDKIETLLGKEGAYVDGIYYCPHHPHKGFKGEVKRLKKDCECRKPKIGMLLKAQKDFNLDIEKCWMVGDSEADVLTGINAGILQIKVKSDLAETETVNPTYRANDLISAVKIITENS